MAKKQRVNGKLLTFYPTSISGCKNITEHILAGNGVIINFRDTSDALCVRIVDYISGVLRVVEGDYRRIGPKEFLVSLSKELSDFYEAQFNELTKEVVAISDDDFGKKEKKKRRKDKKKDK